MVLLFYSVAVVMVLAALAVVVLRNPLHSALCLILTMSGVAVLFAMLDAHFLAVVQLIVYAGAIMVLVVFVLMLLNAKVEAFKRSTVTVMILSLFCASGLLYVYLPLLTSGFPVLEENSINPMPGKSLEGSVYALGGKLFSSYVYPFEIASLLIMAALVGAVMVGSRSIHKREEVK